MQSLETPVKEDREAESPDRQNDDRPETVAGAAHSATAARERGAARATRTLPRPRTPSSQFGLADDEPGALDGGEDLRLGLARSERDGAG